MTVRARRLPNLIGALAAAVMACVSAGCDEAPPPCPSAGSIPGFPSDYRLEDVNGVNVIDCDLIGKTVRQGDLAAAIPVKGEGVRVSASTQQESQPGSLTLTTAKDGILKAVVSD